MRRLSRLICVALFAGAAGFGQTVTEENLLGIVKQGVPDKVIVKAISMAREIKIDMGFENIPVLLNKGISQDVIDALLKRRAELEPKAVVPVQSTQPSKVAGYPSESGVYVRSSSGWTRMEDGGAEMAMGRGMLKMAVNPLARMSNKWEFSGKTAALQLTDNQPQFCIVGHVTPSEVKLIKLDQRKDKRDIAYSEVGLIVGGMRNGVKKDRLQPLKVERVSESIFLVRLEEPLEEGEYALDTGVRPQFDFGIRPAQIASK